MAPRLTLPRALAVAVCFGLLSTGSVAAADPAPAAVTLSAPTDAAAGGPLEPLDVVVDNSDGPAVAPTLRYRFVGPETLDSDEVVLELESQPGSASFDRIQLTGSGTITGQAEVPGGVGAGAVRTVRHRLRMTDSAPATDVLIQVTYDSSTANSQREEATDTTRVVDGAASGTTVGVDLPASLAAGGPPANLGVLASAEGNGFGRVRLDLAFTTSLSPDQVRLEYDTGNGAYTQLEVSKPSDDSLLATWPPTGSKQLPAGANLAPRFRITVASGAESHRLVMRAMLLQLDAAGLVVHPPVAFGDDVADVDGVDPQTPQEPGPQRYIVIFRDTVSNPGEKQRAIERAEGFKSHLSYAGSIKGFAAKLNDAQVQRISRDPDVLFVERARPVFADDVVPLASGEHVPTGVRRIVAAGPTRAHEASTVGVAVLDTGIDLDHPDLNVAGGIDCVNAGRAPDDDHGHGTHVAGSIGARNTGTGVVGVVPGTRLFPVKVLGANGTGTMDQVVCGINWVANNAAALNIGVANMSLGANGSDDGNCGNTAGDAQHRAICAATQAGVHVVVAAGNDTDDLARHVPAAYDQVLTVTAFSDADGTPGAFGGTTCRLDNTDDTFATFSNWATTAADIAHTVAGPGVCIVSTVPGGGHGRASGTSMASPHVAGLVASCLGEGGRSGVCAGLTPAQVVQRIRNEARSFGNANPGTGFAGDPRNPVTGRYYGDAVYAGSPKVRRHYGGDRIATSIQASRAGFANGSTRTVVVARSADPGWTDANPATALAGTRGGPLLLQSATCNNAAVDDEISRLFGGATGTIFVVGGTEAIPACFDDNHRAAGHTVRRLAGADRCATAAAVADEVIRGRTVNDALLVSSEDFADGLSASAVGAMNGWPILVTPAASLCGPTAQFLRSHGEIDRLHVIGGTTAIASLTETEAATACPTLEPVCRTTHRHSGATRYSTSAAVANDHVATPRNHVIATGLNWPDSVSGGVLAWRLGGPVLLVATDSVPSPIADYIQRTMTGTTGGRLVGGYDAVDARTEWTLRSFYRL